MDRPWVLCAFSLIIFCWAGILRVNDEHVAEMVAAEQEEIRAQPDLNIARRVAPGSDRRAFVWLRSHRYTVVTRRPEVDCVALSNADAYRMWRL